MACSGKKHIWKQYLTSPVKGGYTRYHYACSNCLKMKILIRKTGRKPKNTVHTKVALELADKLARDPTQDLSDVGNIVGMVIARYFSGRMGFDLESFKFGLKHGVDVATGRH